MKAVYKGFEIGINIKPGAFLNKQIIVHKKGEFEPVRIKCLNIFAEHKALSGPDDEGFARVFKYQDIEQIIIL